MKKLFLLISMDSLALLSIAQDPEFNWAGRIGGSEEEYMTHTIFDASGNIYTTGYYLDCADFDPGPNTNYLCAHGASTDIFISKLDAAGNYVWAKSIGAYNNDGSRSVAVDGAGNVYITGGFSSTTDFDPGVGVFNLTNTLYADIYIVKLNAAGNFVWAKQVGGNSEIYATRIMADASGNIILNGQFKDTADFDPGAGIKNRISTGYFDIFILKMDSAGNFMWVKTIGEPTSPSGDNAGVFASDAACNIFMTGSFQGTLDVNPGPGIYNLTSTIGNDGFLLKLDSMGVFKWARIHAGTSTNDGASAISIDPWGNLIMSGSFQGSVDFDPGPGTYILNSAGFYDIFIYKLNASGNFVWARSFGDAQFDQGLTLTTDAAGNSYLPGSFKDTVDFDPGPGDHTLISIQHGTDAFVLKLDTSGNFVWVTTVRNALFDEADYCRVDAAGKIMVTGRFDGTADFDPGPLTYNLTAAGTSGYVDLYYQQLIQYPQADFAASSLNTCTGSPVTFTDASLYGAVSWQWSFPGGSPSTSNVQNPPPVTYTATGPKTVTLIITNAAGNDTITKTDYINVNALPYATITASGPVTFCSGGSVVLNAPAGANKTYQWKKGGVNISGATLSSYIATTGGTYKVTVTNTVTGCSKTTASATVVTVNSLPAATITPQGPTTFCAGGSVVLSANTGAGLTYKWKKGSNYISGATLSNYTATTGGNYKVEVTNSNGCSKISANVAVTVPCKEGEISSSVNNLDFDVYPNPNSGEFTIKFSNKPTSSIQIELTDELGKVVKKFETIDETVVIKESNLAKGIYCLIARNKNEIVIKKISIVK